MMPKRQNKADCGRFVPRWHLFANIIFLQKCEKFFKFSILVENIEKRLVPKTKSMIPAFDFQLFPDMLDY